MEIVLKSNDVINKLLINKKIDILEGIFSLYNIKIPLDDGVLLFNQITNELIFFHDDKDMENHKDILIEKGFYVGIGVDEKKKYDQIKKIMKLKNEKKNYINTYVVLTTTACNARCFYCFEKKWQEEVMSEKVANDFADYIISHQHGHEVSLTWFGGEPLMNVRAIDIISSKLKHHNIKFKADIISNGYLFDEEIVNRCINEWNIKRVQITLDGSEKIYNHIKNYKNIGNAYQCVLKNIELLLKKGLVVVIRLNVDLYNYNDLMQLAKELYNKFHKYNRFYVYSKMLFGEKYSIQQNQEKRLQAFINLQNYLYELSLFKPSNIDSTFRINSCIADSDNGYVVSPKGAISACDNYSGIETISSIYRDEFDKNIILSWKEPLAQFKECEKCFLYPSCNILKKCPAEQGRCSERYKGELEYNIKMKVYHAYMNYKKENKNDI